MSRKSEGDESVSDQMKRLSTFGAFLDKDAQEEEQAKVEEEKKQIQEAAAVPEAPAPPAPAQREAIEARLVALHPRFSNSLDEFLTTLNTWTSGLEGEVAKLHGTMAAL